tara:strand:- start:243 stop:428 length:186 start_codon:yes stop_codon:yes gene_type:complete
MEIVYLTEDSSTYWIKGGMCDDFSVIDIDDAEWYKAYSDGSPQDVVKLIDSHTGDAQPFEG